MVYHRGINYARLLLLSHCFNSASEELFTRLPSKTRVPGRSLLNSATPRSGVLDPDVAFLSDSSFQQSYQ